MTKKAKTIQHIALKFPAGDVLIEGRKASEPLYVMLEPEQKTRYVQAAKQLGMSMREFVVHALDAYVDRGAQPSMRYTLAEALRADGLRSKEPPGLPPGALSALSLRHSVVDDSEKQVELRELRARLENVEHRLAELTISKIDKG